MNSIKLTYKPTKDPGNLRALTPGPAGEKLAFRITIDVFENGNQRFTVDPGDPNRTILLNELVGAVELAKMGMCSTNEGIIPKKVKNEEA